MWPISQSPFPADPSNLALIIREHGIVISILALWGIIVGLRASASLRFVSLLMLIWLLLIIEFSSFGFIGRLLPLLGELTNAPNLALHGLILPFGWFGGLALLDIWDGRLSPGLRGRLRQSTYPIIAIAAALLLLGAAAFQPLLDLLGFPPASLTHDELAAMTWLRDNSPADAVVTAVDGNAWLPIFSERRSTDFRAVRYFEWDQIALLDKSAYGADYIYVPADTESPVDTPMELIFEQGNARVYQLTES